MLKKLEHILQKFKFIKLVLASSLIYISCSDMDSIHEEYLNGETIYAGQLDTLNIRPGYYQSSTRRVYSIFRDIKSTYY